MIITIIGWYGTETIGDRAILAGLLSVLSKALGEFEVRLGSLNPVFTYRTLLEDIEFYRVCSGNPNLSISIFNSQSLLDLRKAIGGAEWLIVGGGPLMDLIEMRMLAYAFYFAKKRKIKTAILGCGWGPLKTHEASQIASTLVRQSSLTILRDDVSKAQCQFVVGISTPVYSIIDPAFVACKCFRKVYKTPKIDGEYIAVNFRDLSVEKDHYAQGLFFPRMVKILKQLQEVYECPILLVPMHTFSIGGDDRLILDRLCSSFQSSNIEVMWSPQNLFDTMSLFANAKVCVGMRFHSVVLQTVLNGKNYIVDYTDPEKGKIIGMLKQINAVNQYRERYESLFYDFSLKIDSPLESRFIVSDKALEEFEIRYVSLLNSCLSA